MRISHHSIMFKPVRSALVIAFLMVGFLVTLFPQSAQALSCGGRCCNCNSIRTAMIKEIKKHETWLLDDFWMKQLKPEIEKATDDIRNALTHSSTSQSSIVDAQSSASTLLSRQELVADTVRDASSSESLCRLQSLSRSLGAADAWVNYKHLELAQKSIDRETTKAGQSSAEGSTQDMLDRYTKFKGKFCDIKAYAEGFSFCSQAADYLTNLDIDYTRLVDTKSTITEAEDEAVVPMMNNLFSSRTFNPVKFSATGDNTNSQDVLMEQRALIAKRSVAENTFQAIVARRSENKGSGGNISASMENIKALLKTMGITDDSEVVNYLTKNPSYNAQMEVLTKRAYQDEGFYKNLMDNPTNLSRQYAAMQSFGLMQQRDIYDSIQRSEVLLSLIVEMELEKYQDRVVK